MKFDRLKAFPYPVLRPESDDYADAEFQTTVEPSVGKGKVKIVITYAISSLEIADEIKKGFAEYISIIACRETYFRKVVASHKRKTEVDFDIGELRGEIKIDSYVVVKKSIKSFVSLDINSEFGPGPFNFSVGDILAQDEPQIFYIDRDLFKPIDSVFDLVKKDELRDGYWTISFAEHHVQIEVSKNLKESIDEARNNSKNRVILLNSIFFAAVMQAVQKLKDDKDQYDDRKWAEVVLKQAHNKGCDIYNEDASSIAQKLLQNPLTMLDTFVFKGK